ncbi:hypothetical protein GCM10023085_16430 [Actinomadura viridis]
MAKETSTARSLANTLKPAVCIGEREEAFAAPATVRIVSTFRARRCSAKGASLMEGTVRAGARRAEMLAELATGGDPRRDRT